VGSSRQALLQAVANGGPTVGTEATSYHELAAEWQDLRPTTSPSVTTHLLSAPEASRPG
jgi:hypothetical protein